MEDRKKLEIEYYDKRAFRRGSGQADDITESNSTELSSYRFLYDLLKQISRDKLVLDYGSGPGVHSTEIAKMGAKKVTGIDLSDKSLEVAKKRAGDKVEFLKMDCEQMTFPDKSFDVVFDAGTFSSLDIKKALPEMARVLKLGGCLIGIETLGHNPITNLKRKLNKLTGKRTVWASEHILRMNDLEEFKKYFNKVEVYYFHLISWLAFPFLRFPGGKILLKTLEFLERPFLRLPFFKKYAFKVVFQCY